MLSPSTIRLDLKCGKGAISQGEKCSKGTATKVALAAVGLTAGAVAIGVRGARRPARGKLTVTPDSPSPKPLPGSKPFGLLPPGRAPKSKTQRMRENTQAAMKTAEGRIAQTFQEEVRRIGQIGNTMAATGEATGMAAKTTFRELRLRTEAARRRFEPGYRASRPAPAQAPKMLSPGDPALQLPVTPEAPLTPERVRIQRDPRTGQPRRRKAKGFKSDSGVSFYTPAHVDPALQRDDAKCGKSSMSQGEKCHKGGPFRNYASEIEQQNQTVEANNFNSWRKANKIKKPKTQGSFDRLSKRYAQSKQGATVGEAWQKRRQLEQERNRRNAGIAFVGGAALGVAALALSRKR